MSRVSQGEMFTDVFYAQQWGARVQIVATRSVRLLFFACLISSQPPKSSFRRIVWMILLLEAIEMSFEFLRKSIV
jgi:hypothetical protein